MVPQTTNPLDLHRLPGGGDTGECGGDQRQADRRELAQAEAEIKAKM